MPHSLHACRPLLLLALAIAMPATAATFRWVDENGQVHFGDVIPPEYAEQRAEELNEQGFTIRTIEAAKSPEEQAAERARLRAEAEAQKYDERLLKTYETEAALIRARDLKLQSIESQIDLAEAQRHDRERVLEQLQQRAAERERAGQKTGQKLLDDIATTQRQIEAQQVRIAELRKQSVAVRERFDADLARYRKLRKGR